MRHALRFTPRSGRVVVQVREGNGQAAIEVATEGATLGCREGESPSNAIGQNGGQHKEFVRELWPSMSALGALLSLTDAPGRGHVFKLAFRTFGWRSKHAGLKEA